MRDVFNFSAGPAMLPEEVLLRAQQELVDWNGTGISVMEMSHRGKEFSSIAHHTEHLFRELLAVPPNFKVLFLAGGATTQFSMVPMNLLYSQKTSDYIVTGTWSKKAAEEAQKFGKINQIKGVIKQPSETLLSQFEVSPNATYCYYTDNETIQGIEFPSEPIVGDVPLVCDMTSNILSRAINFQNYGVIFASAQKNMGQAGITVVMIREDLVGELSPSTPLLYSYADQIEQESMMNTPPTYSWYFAGLMMDWIKQQGGVSAMTKMSEQKSQILYDKIDSSDFYINPVAKSCRSRMNVPFTLKDPSLDSKFLDQAKQRGLFNLEGHRSVGGMRASIYLGMPIEGVKRLVEFMSDFENKYS